jgi:hypothetical protein
MKCYDAAKKMENKYKGGERRMLQIELSSTLENSKRLLQHIEHIEEVHKQAVEATNDGGNTLSAEEDRQDLLKYCHVPNAWKGTSEEYEEIQACLMANSIEARRIFHYYSNNGNTMSIDNFFDLVTDASLLSELESNVMVQVYKITVETDENVGAAKNASSVIERDNVEAATTPSAPSTPPTPPTSYVIKQATSEQFIEICLRLAKAMRPHMNVADGLQDIWNEYMCQTRPPKNTWNTVRKFMNEKNNIKVIATRRHMMYTMFQSYMTVPSSTPEEPQENNQDCSIGRLSRDDFYHLCMRWGHIVRGIPPGDINLMFSHATGTFDFESIRQITSPMVFPQFVVAIVGLFLRGGVDPFLSSSKAFVVYLEEHLRFDKPPEEEDEHGNMIAGGIDLEL